MDDLISRKAAVDRLNAIPPGNWSKARYTRELWNVPSVGAVPLDKLCEWLNVHCGRPNDCKDRLCGKCDLDGEGFEYETCWRTLLKEWMEEQDADD